MKSSVNYYLHECTRLCCYCSGRASKEGDDDPAARVKRSMRKLCWISLPVCFFFLIVLGGIDKKHTKYLLFLEKYKGN